MKILLRKDSEEKVLINPSIEVLSDYTSNGWIIIKIRRHY